VRTVLEKGIGGERNGKELNKASIEIESWKKETE